MLPVLLSEQLRQPLLQGNHNLCQPTKTDPFIICSPQNRSGMALQADSLFVRRL